MRPCPRVPPSLPAASPRAVGQLSASLPCSLGVHDVCHVWGEEGAADPGPGGTRIVSPWNFHCVSKCCAACVRGRVRVGERVELCLCCLAGSKAWSVGFGVFLMGGRRSRMVAGASGNLEEACSPAIFPPPPPPPPPGLKPLPSGTGGESKAPSISFINKAN